jgi:hypothetical protein
VDYSHSLLCKRVVAGGGKFSLCKSDVLALGYHAFISVLDRKQQQQQRPEPSAVRGLLAKELSRACKGGSLGGAALRGLRHEAMRLADFDSFEY